MSRFDFVFFDLDDTLLDHRHAERHALADLVAAHPEAFGDVSVELVQDTYHTHNVPLWRAYAAGTLTKENLRVERFARLADAFNLDADPSALSDFYMGRYRCHWTYRDGAEAAYHRVADRFPVGLLTNGFAEVQRAKLARFPELEERATVVVISEDIGVMKPDPQVFEHAAREAGTDADRILYIGDSYTSDVQGGRRSGWHVAWHLIDDAEGPPDVPEEVFCFRAWPDLLAYLEL